MPEIDHIAIAIRSLEKGLAFYGDLLGLAHHGTEEVPTQQVTAAMLSAAGVHIELLEPTTEESPVARFIDRKGEGLHHIALRVDDLDAVLERLLEAGTRLIDTKPRPGVGGTRIAFVHPSAASGVLVELVEQPA